MLRITVIHHIRGPRCDERLSVTSWKHELFMTPWLTRLWLDRVTAATPATCPWCLVPETVICIRLDSFGAVLKLRKYQIKSCWYDSGREGRYLYPTSDFADTWNPFLLGFREPMNGLFSRSLWPYPNRALVDCPSPVRQPHCSDSNRAGLRLANHSSVIILKTEYGVTADLNLLLRDKTVRRVP